jgi:hypothetical protein
MTLLKAEYEEDVIAILRERGLWEDSSLWRLYGDKEGNFAQAGNQQSSPEAALVEKLVNSVDARLMLRCLERAVDPEGTLAPRSIREAVAAFFEEAGGGGLLVRWPKDLRTRESHQITLAATGDKPTRGKATKDMCVTIVDQGEGQSPRRLPETILSLNAKNKQRIPFVQGKFNMGGSGALRFCGKKGLQLVISRRNPNLANPEMDPTSSQWGVTVVRREQPSGVTGEPIHSEFTYLAPQGADRRPRRGDILAFDAPTLPLMPAAAQPYVREIAWGTAIKLYEYEVKVSGSNILFPGGLLYALERLLPEVALPIRVHECRDYSGKLGSFDTTLAGLVARLEDGKAEPLESGFPQSAKLRSDGMDMAVRIYAFREGGDAYLENEGVIFTINGQSHGYLPKSIFSRPKAVGLQRLKDSLLVLVDCSSLSTLQREDLFMSSRDRLSKKAIRSSLEKELEVLLRENKPLRKLQQERKEADIQERLTEEKPLEEVLSKVMKNSPTLESLFLKGQRLSRPFAKGGSQRRENGGGAGKGEGAFVGQVHPTYFKIKDQPYGRIFHRNVELGRRCRIDFETDAENGYFDRAENGGTFNLEVLEGSVDFSEPSYLVTLENGSAHLNMHLPGEAEVGSEMLLEAVVTDPTLLEPFVNLVRLSVKPKSKGGGGGSEKPTPSGAGSGSREGTEGISLPRVVEVREDDVRWKKYHFDDQTACHVITEPVGDGNELEHTFYVNVDNISLKTEMKYSKQDPRLLEAKFKYGNVLLGLGLLYEFEANGGSAPSGAVAEEEETDTSEVIRRYSRAVAPVLIPIIDQLSGLNEDQFAELGIRDEDD